MDPYNFMEDLENHKNLRRAVSDISTTRVVKFGKGGGTLTKMDEVRQAECECCGLREDCTPDYIENVMKSHSGKWVCGLCSEAVKEKLNQSPNVEAIEEAVSMQRDFCQSFNRTTRLNPKLSLTLSLKKISSRSFESRNFTGSSSSTKSNNNIARSSSCVPRIDLINIHGRGEAEVCRDID